MFTLELPAHLLGFTNTHIVLQFISTVVPTATLARLKYNVSYIQPVALVTSNNYLFFLIWKQGNTGCLKIRLGIYKFCFRHVVVVIFYISQDKSYYLFIDRP